MFSQINCDLIENIELTEPVCELYTNLNMEINKVELTNVKELINENLNFYKHQSKYFLVKKLREDKILEIKLN